MSGAAGPAGFLAADEYDDAFGEDLVAAGILSSLGPLGEQKSLDAQAATTTMTTSEQQQSRRSRRRRSHL